MFQDYFMEGTGMALDDKLLEKKLLLKRAFSRTKLYEIGKDLKIPYFSRFMGPWDMDEDEAAFEIASKIDDMKLKGIFKAWEFRGWAVFRGRYYNFENGALNLEGFWKQIRSNIFQIKKKYGKNCVAVLKALAEAGESCGLEEIKGNLKRGIDPQPILEELERLKVIVTSYRGGHHQEWKILEETSPLVQSALGMAPLPTPSEAAPPPTSVKGEKVDYVWEEQQTIKKLDEEFEGYLQDLLKNRLDAAVDFGKVFSVAYLASYLQDLFGPMLYFDSLLSIIQQYGLSATEIIHHGGRTGMKTGWSLALFGEPGTGKSFSTRDMILGRPGTKILPHGVPGRNRYCGGITPARFIRIGQAYVDRAFNFIVPEFNDWFKYSGMVEPLKLAMERGEIKYEMHREVIGPYRFNSFFSVNYNVATYGRGYAVTIQDPNFNAIEDRMLCRLHRLTKERFVEIAKSQMRLAFGEIDVEEGAQKIRDHATLIYAIETGHPLVKDLFPYKPVMITPQAYDMIKRAREAILEQIPHETVSFSARLEDRAIRFASAASLLGYFQSNLNHVPLSEEALRYATRLYVEEASVRSRGEFQSEEILKRLL